VQRPTTALTFAAVFGGSNFTTAAAGDYGSVMFKVEVLVVLYPPRPTNPFIAFSRATTRVVCSIMMMVMMSCWLMIDSYKCY
jgi:hypothetical protein